MTSNVDGGSDGASDAPKPDPPTSTVGSGRDDVDVKSADEDKKKNDFPAGSNKSKGSFTVRILRIPRKDELPASGLQNRSLFRTTVVIPVRTLAEFFAAMQPEPEPPPQPGPAFRTQEEGPPVADSGGGGVDPVSTGVAAEPPVLQAPMVIAPLPIPPPQAIEPVAPRGISAGAGLKQAVAADAVAVGARAPVSTGVAAWLPALSAQPDGR